MTEPRDYVLPPELVELASRVIEANRAAGRRVAVAESCTGGLVAAALTEIAGSSDVFEAGFVTYSNEAKAKLLQVSDDVIETFGSVSVAVAWAMAQGALDDSGADVAVALTGIAGPGGRIGPQAGRHRRLRPRRARGRSQSGSTADTKTFDDLGRGGVRLQAALCALELLLPDLPAP